MKWNKEELFLFFKKAFKFGLVGVLNTLVTLAVIFLLKEVLGVFYVIANWIGFVFGVLNSYFFNKIWTFKSKNPVKGEAVLFFAVTGVCYLIQLGALVLMKEVMKIPFFWAQLIAMVIYTGFGFLGNNFVTFRSRK